MNAIGIDLYLKMLEQTVEELRGAPAKLEVRTSLNLGLDIKIPDPYIPDENQRLRMYKRISSAATVTERADLEGELTDRFGPIPPSVSNLLDYALLKSAAERLLVHTVERKGDEVWIKFHEQAPVDPLRVARSFGGERTPASARTASCASACANARANFWLTSKTSCRNYTPRRKIMRCQVSVASD